MIGERKRRTPRRSDVNATDLDQSIWAWGIDMVGGDVLAWLLRGAEAEAAIAAIGNAGATVCTTRSFPSFCAAPP